MNTMRSITLAVIVASGSVMAVPALAMSKDSVEILVNGPPDNPLQALHDYGAPVHEQNQAFDRGYTKGMNDGFLDGYGAATGMTPGPVEVQLGGRGGSSSLLDNQMLSPSMEVDIDTGVD